MSDHVLIITGTGDEREYAIECPGVGPTCQMWTECEACRPASNINELDDAMWDAGGMAHGVKHQRFSWAWCVPAEGRCFARDNDEMPEAAEDADRGQLAPGRYPVDFDVIDETGLQLMLAADLNEGETRHG